jgi:large subunit ribosomal protein L29
MAAKQTKELRDMPLDELEQRRDESYAQIFRLSNVVQEAKKNEKPHQIRQVKKELARILTLIHEKKCEAL